MTQLVCLLLQCIPTEYWPESSRDQCWSLHFTVEVLRNTKWAETQKKTKTQEGTNEDILLDSQRRPFLLSVGLSRSQGHDELHDADGLMKD